MNTLDFNTTNLERVLKEVGHDAVERYRYQLSLGDKVASRKLIDSVNMQVKKDGADYEVILNLEDYWKYIEGGSKGTEESPSGAVYPAHLPPVGVIRSWISVKPILPRPDITGKIPSPQSLAYLISRAILRRGIEPHPAMETTIKETEDVWMDKIKEALAQDAYEWVNIQLGDIPSLLTEH